MKQPGVQAPELQTFINVVPHAVPSEMFVQAVVLVPGWHDSHALFGFTNADATTMPPATAPSVPPSTALPMKHPEPQFPPLQTSPWPQLVPSFTLLHTVAFVAGDRKSTRLNSSHITISYAVFCLKKKK